MARAPGLGGQGRERALRGLGLPLEPRFERAIASGLRPISQPTTPWQFPDSTRVRAFQYDPDSQQLRVRFSKYNTPWVYENVPSAVYQSFASAPSKGKYINSTLNFLPYRRATAQEEAQHFQGV